MNMDRTSSSCDPISFGLVSVSDLLDLLSNEYAYVISKHSHRICLIKHSQLKLCEYKDVFMWHFYFTCACLSNPPPFSLSLSLSLHIRPRVQLYFRFYSHFLVP